MNNFYNLINRGVLQFGFARYLGVIIQFAVIAYISRILSADDFGIAATLIVFISLFKVVSQGGISSAIIQKNNLNDSEIVGVFYLNLVFALTLSAISYLIATLYFGSFYTKINQTILWIIPTLTFISANQSIPDGILRRRKKFKRLSSIEIISNLLGNSSIIYCTAVGFTYESILFGYFFREFFITTGLFIGFRINLISRPYFKSFLYFLRFSVKDQIIIIQNYITRSIDILLIGRLIGFYQLGIYERANKLALFSIKNFADIINTVLHPTLISSNLSIEHKRKIFSIVNEIVFIIFLPLTVYLIYSSESLILLIFGAGWEKVSLIYQYLTISLIPQILVSFNKSFFYSVNKQTSYLKLNILNNAIIIILITYGVFSKDIELISLFISLGYILRWCSELIFNPLLTKDRNHFVPKVLLLLVVVFSQYLIYNNIIVEGMFLKLCLNTIILFLILILNYYVFGLNKMIASLKSIKIL